MKLQYLVADLANPFWKQAADSAAKAAVKGGASLDVRDAGHSEEKQIAQLEQARTSKPDAVLISPTGMTRLPALCRELMQSGMTLVAVDQYMMGDTTASVMSGNRLGAIAACAFIAGKTGTGGRVIHIQAEQTVQNAAMRRKSFIEDVAARGLEIVKTIQAEGQREKAFQAMRGLLAEGAPFDAVFAENDHMALGVIQALEAANPPAKSVVVGYDGIPEALQAIRAGKLAATVAQNPAMLGEKAVETAVKILQGSAYDQLTTVLSHLVTSGNLKEFLPRTLNG